MDLRINPNKRIGRVLFLVEGDEDEPSLLETIFCDVLGYGLIRYDKRDQSVREYGKTDDPYSRVFVVPTPTSAITHLPAEEDYLDAVYRTLASHGLSGMEAATYYLFDRDWQSNTEEAVLTKIGLLRNPYDNGAEMGGALLLSYPCLQAYYCQAHCRTSPFSESQEAKAYVNANRLKSLDAEKIIIAASHTLLVLAIILGRRFELADLNDYFNVNHKVFGYQQSRRFGDEKTFLTLSLLSLALIDLGIISWEEEL